MTRPDASQFSGWPLKMLAELIEFDEAPVDPGMGFDLPQSEVCLDGCWYIRRRDGALVMTRSLSDDYTPIGAAYRVAQGNEPARAEHDNSSTCSTRADSVETGA